MSNIFKNARYRNELEKIIETEESIGELANKSILVIGATGMIGSYLIDTLMYANRRNALNVDIYAMGRSEERLIERFSDFLRDDSFKIIIGDVTDPLPESIKVDYIIHAASNTHPKAYATDPIGTIMTSILGTENVLKHALASGAKRTMFLSTVEIYGENRGDVDLFSEDYCGYIDCNTLRAGYPEGKRVSEALCQSYIAKYNLDIVIPRLSRVFGPTMLLSDSKASSQFIINAVNNEDIVLKSAGTQYFSYIYVADAVTALIHLLVAGKNGEAYNVAGGNDYDVRLKELAKRLADIGNSNLVFELPDETESRGFSKASKALLNIDKISATGWKPRFGFDEALMETVEILASINR